MEMRDINDSGISFRMQEDDSWARAVSDSRSREALQKAKEAEELAKAMREQPFLYIGSEEPKVIIHSPLNECVKLIYVIEKTREELEEALTEKARIYDKHYSDVITEITQEKKYGGCLSEDALAEIDRRVAEEAGELLHQIEAMRKLIDVYRKEKANIIEKIIKEML